MTDKETTTGVRPEIQGYWARIEGRKEPPNHFPDHKEAWWVDRWWKGWHERDEWENR